MQPSIEGFCCCFYGLIVYFMHRWGYLKPTVGMMLNCIMALVITSRLQWITGGFKSPVQLGPSLFAFRVCIVGLPASTLLAFRAGLLCAWFVYGMCGLVLALLQRSQHPISVWQRPHVHFEHLAS